MDHDTSDRSIVKGEFYTDGERFVLRLAGAPLSGVGPDANAAFEDLMRAQGAAGDLAAGLARLSRDQEDEKTRLAVIRLVLTALIVFGVVGGALAGAAAMAPGFFAQIVEIANAPDPGATLAPAAPAADAP